MSRDSKARLEVCRNCKRWKDCAVVGQGSDVGVCQREKAYRVGGDTCGEWKERK